MASLSNDNQTGIIKAFNFTSGCLDDLLHINISYFDGIINRIYPHALQFIKADAFDSEVKFLDLYLSVLDGSFHSKFMIN